MSTGLTRAAEKKRRRDWFRNLRVGTKLAAGFGAIVALLVLTALFAMYSINGISAQIRLYSRYTVPNAEHIRVLQVSLQDIRHLLLAAVVAVDETKALAAGSTEQAATSEEMSAQAVTLHQEVGKFKLAAPSDAGEFPYSHL